MLIENQNLVVNPTQHALLAQIIACNLGVPVVHMTASRVTGARSDRSSSDVLLSWFQKLRNRLHAPDKAHAICELETLLTQPWSALTAASQLFVISFAGSLAAVAISNI